jgi:hypothetical protein
MIGKVIKITPGPGIQIRKKGVLDLRKLYGEISAWFEDNEYDFNEDVHSDKHKDKGREIITIWSGERNVTNYIKYKIKVNFSLNEINKVSNVSDKLDKGFIKLTFNAQLVLDYKSKWGKSFFSNFLFKTYNNYIIKKEIVKHKSKLYKEVLDLQDVAKEILEFHR